MSGSKGFGWENKGATIASGFLQIQGGVPLDTTLRTVTDKVGTASILKLSTTLIEVDNGASPSYIQFTRTYSGSENPPIKGSVGALGGFEMNLSYNMDYAGDVHNYYNNTHKAFWLAMGDSGVTLQYAPPYISGDIWVNAGRDLWNLNDYHMRLGTTSHSPATGTANQYGSIDLILRGSCWTGSAAVNADWNLVVQADTTQNNYPRIVGDYNTVRWIRADKSIYTSNLAGIGHTTFGYEAGAVINSTSYGNSFFGAHAGRLNTSGYENTFLGINSGSANTTGYQNVYIGRSAGAANTVNIYNTLIGYNAGSQVATGDENTFIGWSCGRGAVSSSAAYNTAFGSSALLLISSGIENVAVGRGSGASLTTGNGNTLIGMGSALVLTTGSDNTIIGYKAGYTDVVANGLTTGSQCVFIGQQSGFGSTTQRTNAIAVGYRAKVDADNTVVIGNTSIVKTILRGIINIANTPTSAAGLSAGDIWSNSGVLTIV